MEGAIELDKGGARVKMTGLNHQLIQVHTVEMTRVTFPAVFFESVFLNT